MVLDKNPLVREEWLLAEFPDGARRNKWGVVLLIPDSSLRLRCYRVGEVGLEGNDGLLKFWEMMGQRELKLLYRLLSLECCILDELATADHPSRPAATETRPPG